MAICYCETGATVAVPNSVLCCDASRAAERHAEDKKQRIHHKMTTNVVLQYAEKVLEVKSNVDLIQSLLDGTLKGKVLIFAGKAATGKAV